VEEVRTNTGTYREMHTQEQKWWLHRTYFTFRNHVTWNYPDDLHKSTDFLFHDRVLASKST